MKSVSALLKSIFLVSIFLNSFIFSTTPLKVIDPASEKRPELTYSKSLKVSDVENFLGRKMNFGERLAFKLNKKKVTNIYIEEEKNKKAGEMDNLAVIGFVLSIFLAPVGLLLCAISLSNLKKSGKRGKGFALAGLTIGIILTSLFITAFFVKLN